MHACQIESFGQPLVTADRPTPAPQGREVLLRVRACGVCHSDLHLADGYFDLGDGKKIELARGIAPPRILGHEIVGEVVAAGPEAGNVPKGARRLIYPWIGCGACALCRAGNEHLCNASRAIGVQRDGGYADHVIVPDARYLLDFGDLDEDQACTYACSGVTAYSALKKVAGLAADEKLLIIGAGGVGLAGVRLAGAVAGVAPMVADIGEAKRKAALAAGASEAIDPATPDAARALVKATGGGVAAAVDFVGSAATFKFGTDALRKGGKYVVVGLFGGSAQVSPPQIVLKAVTIQGSYVGSLDELRALIALAQKGALPPLPVESWPLDKANDVLTRLRQGQIVGRAVLRP